LFEQQEKIYVSTVKGTDAVEDCFGSDSDNDDTDNDTSEKETDDTVTDSGRDL